MQGIALSGWAGHGGAWLGNVRFGEALRGKARRGIPRAVKKGDELMSKRIVVTITGITPLLMNRFHENTEVKVSSGVSAVSISGRGTPREQATLKAYADSKGYLYIPGPNIFSCLIQAGKFHKAGKSKITTLKSSLVPAGISVLELVCPLGTTHFEVDSRSVVIPSTGGRIMAHRPRLDEWSISFTLEVDTDMFDLKTVRLLLDDAGKKVGLGDFRPDRKGPFGKFTVTRWEETEG